MTYLLPAPKEAIAFAPFLLADRMGFYAKAGLAVSFVTIAGGGAKVGEALSRGEGDLGGASGDTPILLRDRGFAVKGVALLGGHAFLTLITDHARAVSPATLKGRTIDVPSFKDVSYYALEAAVGAAGLAPADLTVRAKAPAELWTELGTRQVDGIVGTVDWGVRAERSGVALDWTSVDHFYPAMAQAILASDAEVAAHPARIRNFIRATLAALAAIRRDPARCALLYHHVVPGSDLTDAEIERTFRLFARYVYSGQRVPGAFDDATVAAMQKRYLQLGLLAAEHAGREIVTNRFVE